MMHIEIIRQSDDQMRQSVWSFWYYDNRHALVLDGYREESRESRRQKFRVNCMYSRLRSRDATIDELAVHIPEDVTKELLDKFMSSLRVARWSDIR